MVPLCIDLSKCFCDSDISVCVLQFRRCLVGAEVRSTSLRWQMQADVLQVPNARKLYIAY